SSSGRSQEGRKGPMTDKNPAVPPLSSPTSQPSSAEPAGVSRRGFLGAGGLAAAVMAAGGLGLEPLARGGSAAAAEEQARGAGVAPAVLRRDAAWSYRKGMADANRSLPLSPHPDNGDEARYGNRIGSYSKGLPHNRFGEVDEGAYASYRAAIDSGAPGDFEN